MGSQSGADVSCAGDEVLGFVSAVLAPGTAGVTAVPDVAAAELVVLLHERLWAGRTLARALFEAREGLDRQNPAAYVNWCTFTAYDAARATACRWSCPTYGQLFRQCVSAH